MGFSANSKGAYYNKITEKSFIVTNTVNVDIFVLYIFSRLSNVRENMYILKITYNAT